MSIQVFTGLGATPVLAFSGRGRVTLAGTGRICDATGTTVFGLNGLGAVTLELREAADIYVNGTGSGSVSLISTSW